MIKDLKPNQIFVFGSNQAGRHGKGAAKYAKQNFGAKPGVGEGPTGRCYAIPTKDHKLRVRSLTSILASARRFVDYAKAHPELEFILTPVGCGLAGYRPKQIAPLFSGAPSNVKMPREFASNLI
jgi:hypothetical protein